MVIELQDMLNTMTTGPIDQGQADDTGDLPLQKKHIREAKQAYLRAHLGPEKYDDLAGRPSDLLIFESMLRIVPAGEENNEVVWEIQPLPLPSQTDREVLLGNLSGRGDGVYDNSDVFALQSLEASDPQYTQLSNPVDLRWSSEGFKEEFKGGQPLGDIVSDIFASGAENRTDALELKNNILAFLADNFGPDMAESLYKSGRGVTNPTTNMAEFVVTTPDGQTHQLDVNLPSLADIGGYDPTTLLQGQEREAAFAPGDPITIIDPTNPTTSIRQIQANEPIPTGFLDVDTYIDLYGTSDFRDQPTKVDVPYGEGTIEVSPETAFTQGQLNTRADQVNELAAAQNAETTRFNNLSEAYRQKQLAQNQAQFQANLAEQQGQFDRSLALRAMAQQSQDEATRINAQLQMSQQNIQRLTQITEALSRPSDAVAASFALTGQESPMGVFTQADAVNPYIADMMDQRSAMEAFGPGFRAEDFMEGYGRRANPVAENPDPKGVMSIGSTDQYGNQVVTLFDGTEIVRTAPTAPPDNTNIMNEHGGHSFGNPIVVGDSSKNEENQELVMSLGNAPMVVLPLNEQQEKIMADANRKIPKFQYGGSTFTAQESAFTPANTRDRVGNPGLAGFESLYPLTQGMIQERSDLLTPPRARRVLQGTADESVFRQMPTQMPFALPTPGFMRNLTGTEREFLRSNLATRNIFLDDVESAVAQRFGRTNTSQGRRRFR